MKKRYEERILKYLLWNPYAISIEKQGGTYISVLCLWSSHVLTQGWPSPSPDLTLYSYSVVKLRFFFNGNWRGKLKYCEKWKEAATGLLTQFPVNVKNEVSSCKKKYFLTQIGDVMQNRMRRLMIKQNKRNLHSIVYILCAFDFHKILSKIILSPLPTQRIQQKQKD